MRLLGVRKRTGNGGQVGRRGYVESERIGCVAIVHVGKAGVYAANMIRINIPGI